MRLQAKIIGKQVWTAENLTREQFKYLTGADISLENSADWGLEKFEEIPLCASYVTEYDNKINYLFNKIAADCIKQAEHKMHWRMPSKNDWDTLFEFIHLHSKDGDRLDNICNGLRGNYGWENNGTNRFGFNAFPTPYRDTGGGYVYGQGARWWASMDHALGGVGLIQELNILDEFDDQYAPDCMAIRLVMDLPAIRIEEGIQYI